MNRKRIFSTLLAFALMATLLPVHTFAASVTSEKSDSVSEVSQEMVADDIQNRGLPAGPTGRLPIQCEEPVAVNPEEALEAVGSYGGYTPYDKVADWDDYASNYYYNRMDDWQKKAYDRMDEAAKYYLNTTNAIVKNVNGRYCITVDLSDLHVKPYQYIRINANNEQENVLYQVYALFIFSNPQYFFMRSGCGMTYDRLTGEVYELYMMVYDEMTDGVKRRAAIDQVDTQVESLLAEFKQKSGQLEQEKAIHDWICERVVYDNEGFALMSNANEFQVYEMSHYTQSAYSVFRATETLPDDKSQHETVCAGYAQAFSLLCNALDIDTVTVTSTGHQWNRTRLNGNWYTVDCTWDDIDEEKYPDIYEFYGGYYYAYFNRSTAWINEHDTTYEDEYGNKFFSHEVESYEEAYMPSSLCAEDKICEEEDPDGEKPGTVREASGVLSSPSYSAYIQDNILYMTLSTADGSDVYYTTNGKTPTVNDEKSILYKGEFVVSLGTKVQAIAYKNGYLDSEVFQMSASVSSGLPAKYTVNFNGNGGTATKSSVLVTKGQGYGTLPGATRTGYTFAGWYTQKSGGTKITSATIAQMSAPQTLYAQWTANQYKVTFNVNGGKALSASKKTKQVTYGAAYGTLVTPARKGYEFSGWYTQKSGGSKITNSSVVKITANTTLYAHWKKVSVAKAKKPTLKSTKKKQLKITFKKVSAAKGYQIRYSTSAKFTKKTTHTVSQTGLSKTLTKLKSGKKYYVQVRAYKLDSAKQKVYGAWSSKVSKTIK